MKKDKKILIVSVLDLLQERDPEWKKAKMAPKFKVLYNGWRATELRHKIHSHGFYTLSLRRGWLPSKDWKRFRDYAMQ